MQPLSSAAATIRERSYGRQILASVLLRKYLKLLSERLLNNLWELRITD